MSFDSGAPPDPVASATKGAVKAVLEYSEEKLKELVERFKNKDLVFIQDKETIEIAKEQREKGEWAFFKIYVKDNDLRILFQMGLTLRELEKQGKDLQPLLKKIHKRFDRNGVHIAHFVENGLFSIYVGHAIEIVSSTEELKEEIDYLFEHIDHTVSFIKEEDKSKQKAGEIVTKIQSFSPITFIISSVGKAKSNCEKVKKMVMQKVSQSYTCELYEKKGKKIYFLNRIVDNDF